MAWFPANLEKIKRFLTRVYGRVGLWSTVFQVLVMWKATRRQCIRLGENLGRVYSSDPGTWTLRLLSLGRYWKLAFLSFSWWVFPAEGTAAGHVSASSSSLPTVEHGCLKVLWVLSGSPYKPASDWKHVTGNECFDKECPVDYPCIPPIDGRKLSAGGGSYMVGHWTATFPNLCEIKNRIHSSKR